MMARRTDSVVDATTGRAAGSRGRVSTATMESRRASEGYTAVIVPRKDAGARSCMPPRVRFVVFATGAPWVDVEWHGMRLGIEARYRGPGRARIRTAATNPAGRALCMAHSPVMPSAWAVAMPMAALDAVASRTAIRGAHNAQRVLRRG